MNPPKSAWKIRYVTFFLRKFQGFLINSMIFWGNSHEMSKETVSAFNNVKGWLWCHPNRLKVCLKRPQFSPWCQVTFLDCLFHREPDLTKTSGNVQTKKMAKAGPPARPPHTRSHQPSEAAALGAGLGGGG